MILYQTIFNVDAQDKSLEDVKNICCSWLYDSQNSKFNRSNLNFSAYDDFDITSDNESEKIITNYVNYDELESFYFEYIKDLKRPDQWITTIAVEKKGTNFTIGVKLKTISKNPKPNNKPIKKPIIIGRLIDEIGAAFDGDFLIDEVQYLDHSEYSLNNVSKFINGDFQGHLPCLYMSQPLLFNTAQIAEIQKELFGLAHIFIEPQENFQKFSYLLKKMTAGKNAYQGSIGIYWKDGVSKKLFLKDQEISDLIEDLKKLVRSSLLMQKFPHRLTRHFILEKKFRSQIEALKQKDLKDPQDYEDLIKLYEQEIDAKNKKIIELENSPYQYDYQSFHKATDSIKSNSNSIAIPYTVPEYFPKEVQHKIYNLLKDLQIDQLGLEDRNKEIFESIIDNINSDPDYLAYLNQTEQLKNILNGFQGNITKLRKCLSYFNIELNEDGKHIKANFKADTRYPQSFAKTPSDKRAGMNIYREFKKILK